MKFVKTYKKHLIILATTLTILVGLRLLMPPAIKYSIKKAVEHYTPYKANISQVDIGLWSGRFA